MIKKFTLFALIACCMPCLAQTNTYINITQPETISVANQQYDSATHEPRHLSKDALSKMDFSAVQQKAKQGDALAQYYLGLFYYRGIHVPQDKKQSIAFLQQAAKQGNHHALTDLGILYYIEKTENLKQDTEKAIELLRQAVKQNNPLAQVHLGRILINHNNPTLQQEGIAMLKQAADMPFAPAYLPLYVIYLEGDIVPKDKKLATEYLQKGAQLGDAQAQYVLADGYLMISMFSSGEESVEIIKNAYYWANRSCVNGFAQACKMIKEYFTWTEEQEKKLQEAKTGCLKGDSLDCEYYRSSSTYRRGLQAYEATLK